MKEEQGFTLIELLAVIVILAIIALIATPIVINVINKARKSAFQDSAYGIIKAGELFYAESLLKPEGLESEKTFAFPSDTELEFKGTKPKNGTLKVNVNGETELVIHNGTYCATKGYKETAVTVEKKSLEDCGITNTPTEYQESILNGAYPEIGEGMIPVTIENDGIVKKADVSTSWYSYQDKKWANVVTVTEASRSKYTSSASGTIIAEADILTYLVWIPRYKYQLWNVNGDSSGSKTGPFQISVVFENKSTAKSTGTTNGSWLTHPSFTFGTGNEINGYWVGKFETGYSGATSTASAQVDSNDPSKVIIKPNTYSWRNITVFNAFFTVQEMKNSGNVFGLSTSSDSHMMKNSEWGAVAYLSHSQYGTNKQVRINNNQNYMTGCAASTEDAAGYAGCQNAWNTSTGYLASTTGNITGVYDMSGGAWEYVMGYTTGASTQYGSSEFTSSNFPSTKYVDIYTATSNTQYSDGHLGDATKEVGAFSSYRSSWYQDYADFVYSSHPWFIGGGGHGDGTGAGAFCFSLDAGGTNSGNSFRVVVLGQ